VYPPHLVCHRCARRFTGEGEDGAWLSPLDSVLTCAPCADGMAGNRLGTSLSSGALAFLAHARMRGPSDLGDLSQSGGVLAELEMLHRALMVRHLERELRSPRVLRAMKRGH
jgi:hypothetical protein